MSERNEIVEGLRWKKFPVLDQGHVCLVDVMGDDSSICEAARISYGKGTRKVSEDRDLIRYLYRHHHMTPFEMAEIKLAVKVPMDCWRQWIRHRTANVNEYSTRYSEAIDAAQATSPDGWRVQATANRQGSSGFLDGKTGGGLSIAEMEFQSRAREVYEERLRSGVAREQARKDLPLSTYTMAYWKCDLRNVFHFLGLRMDSHAQIEIQSYARVIAYEIVAKLFPLCWEAFRDYTLEAVTLSRLDVEAIRAIACHADPAEVLGQIANKREREECKRKLLDFYLISEGDY